jgi:hypothetical protein
MGLLPKVYKCICGFYLPKNPLDYDQLSNATHQQSIPNLFCYMTKPYLKILYLDLYLYHLSKIFLK